MKGHLEIQQFSGANFTNLRMPCTSFVSASPTCLLGPSDAMASAYSSSSSVSAQTIGGTSSWTEKSSIWDCGPDVGHRQAGNPNVLAQYLMTNIFKMEEAVIGIMGPGSS